MDLEDLLTALYIGQTDIDLTVKTAGTQQRLIQDVGTVGSSHHDDAIVGIEAVHLDQQLVQGLLAFIMAAAQTGAALAAHGIDLIDKDDGRHGLFSFFKQVTYTGGTDTDVHFDKVRAGDGVERHTRLACAGTGQQRFTSTRRAHQQHAVGNTCAQGIELAWSLEELDDFLQFFLFFISTSHISEGRLALALLLVLDLGTADIHDAAARTATVHRHEQHTDAAQHDRVEDDLQPGHAGLDGHVVEDHRGVGVGLIVGVHKLGDLTGVEVATVGQLIADVDGSAVGGQFVVIVLATAEVGQQAARRQICRGGRILRQGHLALFKPHLQEVGVAVQPVRGYLLILEIIVDVRVIDMLGSRSRHQRRETYEKQYHYHEHGNQQDAAETRFALQEINS